MKLKAVFFDLDGTIADSEDLHRRSFNAAFSEFGLKWHWDFAIYKELLSIAGGQERIRHYIERAEPAMLTRPDLTNFVKAMHKAKNQTYNELVRQEKFLLREGTEELITALQGEGIKCVIVTSTSAENVATALERGFGKGYHKLFATIADGDKVKHKKPSTDLYIWALGELGLSAESCIAVEDTPRGVEGATLAHIKAVAVTSTYTEGEEFPNAVAVVDGFGTATKPFTLISGSNFGLSNVISPKLLRLWLG